MEIPVEELELGMYVADLDRPWLDTPFLFQGFQLVEPDDLASLRRLCRTVHVDVRDLSPEKLAERSAAEPPPPPPPPPPPRVQAADVARPMAAELPRAAAVEKELLATVTEAMDQLRRGHVLEVAKLKAVTSPLVDSIESNPDALAWLAAMRRKDGDMYRQSVGASVLCATFGRHLGLPRASLEHLALGGLLFDVGKTRLPNDVLLKPDRLTDAEFEIFKGHVLEGLAILEKSAGIPAPVLEMTRTHHERHDGSGYLEGASGADIPVFGRIAGIVDAYLTMVSNPHYGSRHSAHEALRYLIRRRGAEFDAALVEEFVQAIGIYPTGTIVRLSDGRVGVITEQNRLRRLKPTVMIVLDERQCPLANYVTVNLVLEPLGIDGKPLSIVDCLEEGAFGIDPEELFL